jgi:HTH-type transcriptional regulator, sugar sensing transcriptional regulator
VPTEESVQALTSLGFTGLEAEIYAYLLSELPSSGYRVAQALGRPVANVYKALENLQAKGAVVVEQGGTRLSRAVPMEELLKSIEREFRDRAGRAREALGSLKPTPADARVYQLASREQVIERCRSMLARARQLVIADLFPEPFRVLKADVEAAAGRGVTALIKTFEPATLAGARVIVNPRGRELVDRYPGEWIILVIDGAELVIASLARDRRSLHQAIWTESPTLSWIVHTSFAAEMMFCELCSQIAVSGDMEEIKSAVMPMVEPGGKVYTENLGPVQEAMAAFSPCFARDLPGYLSLLEQFGKVDITETQSDKANH